MKKILSMVLVIVIFAFAGSLSAFAQTRKFPQMVHDELAKYEDTDTLYVTIEVYTGIKVMDRWEYFWREGIDMSRFETNKDYKDKAYDEFFEYLYVVESQNIEILKDFYYNEFGAPKDDRPFNGLVGAIGAKLTVSDIKRLESFDKVLGVTIYKPGYDVLFDNDPQGFATEIYNTEYLGNTADEAVPVEVYGLDNLYALFRGGQVKSYEYSEEIIDDLFIFGSEYTHSDDNPTGLFAVTESGVIRTLKEGFDLNVLHIDRVAMELPYLYMIGDANYDHEINVRDATMIQKLVAGLEEYRDVVCVSRPEDKDRDGRVTVKDATAVQKYIAGIDL